MQVTTAVMVYGYRIIDDLKEGLARFLAAEGKTLKEVVGMSVHTVTDLEAVERDRIILPRFKRENPKRCVGCHLCTLVCPAFAIRSQKD